MRMRSALLSLVVAVAAAAAVFIPIALMRGGSIAVPMWIEAASPGPLSRAHATLDRQCELCHVPLRGVEATGCVTCHAADAPQVISRPATAFHAEMGECAGCHVEHRGRAQRPVAMDHSVLVEAGRRVSRASSGREVADTPFSLERLASWLSRGVADVAGTAGQRGRSLPAAHAASLDCATCHSNQDPHRTLFGGTCQSCHDTSTWLIATYLHPSPRSTQCAQCHQAPPSHFMMHFEMMDRTIARQPEARVDQCHLCHQTDAWNNIRGVGWFKHH